MNKKFTTFLASAMLVSAFSVGTVAAYVGTPVAPQATMAAEETPDPNATITPKKGEAVLFQNGSEAKFLGITKERPSVILQRRLGLLSLHWRT